LPTLTATLELPTPTVVVEAPADQSAPVVAPTVVVPPTDIPVQPTVVQPTVEQPTVVVVPTDVAQPIQPTAVVQDQQAGAAGGSDQQPSVAPTAIVIIPASPIPTDAGTVPTPVIVAPTSPLGTLPPASNISPTAESPVVIPNVVLPTAQMTVQAALMQVAGQIGAPLRADSAGIVVVLTLPDGTSQQTMTDAAGNFAFANLAPGNYRVDAGVVGYLSSQTTFTLNQDQNLVLPSAMLVGGDTNQDNKIDLTDAALIAANFDSSSIVAGADLNHDGIVDIRDLTAIGAFFGLSGPTQWNP